MMKGATPVKLSKAVMLGQKRKPHLHFSRRRNLETLAKIVYYFSKLSSLISCAFPSPLGERIGEGLT
jgi:hypothetical protein